MPGLEQPARRLSRFQQPHRHSSRSATNGQRPLPDRSVQTVSSLNRELTLCDQALEADPCISGVPPTRVIEKAWVDGLLKVVDKPFNRHQLTAHVAELERQISHRSRRMNRQTSGLLDQRDTAVDVRQRLVHLLTPS